MKFLKNIIKKIKELKAKFNVNFENNIPREVYGVPVQSPQKKYDVDPKKNIPQKVYGVPDYIKPPISPAVPTPSENSFDTELTKITGDDIFWKELVKKYFNEDFKCDEATALNLLRKISTNTKIFNEFFRYLNKKNYDIENAVDIDGMTAKKLASDNPEKAAVEIYAMLSELSEKKSTL